MKSFWPNRSPRLTRLMTASAVIGVTAVFSVPAFAQTTVSAQQADQIALQSVGGGTVSHISSDHYHGMTVWDIHVAYNNQVWDVLVNTMNGTVENKKLSNEQLSHSQSSSLDSHHFSKDHSSKDHSQFSASSDLKDAKDHKSLAISSFPGTGLAFNQKLTSVPSGYQTYVSQALSSVGGKLKWVKFSHKDSTDIQMNIKIQKNSGGATKVNDVFSSSGQLLSQRIPTDN